MEAQLPFLAGEHEVPSPEASVLRQRAPCVSAGTAASQSLLYSLLPLPQALGGLCSLSILKFAKPENIQHKARRGQQWTMNGPVLPKRAGKTPHLRPPTPPPARYVGKGEHVASTLMRFCPPSIMVLPIDSMLCQTVLERNWKTSKNLGLMPQACYRVLTVHPWVGD